MIRPKIKYAIIVITIVIISLCILKFYISRNNYNGFSKKEAVVNFSKNKNNFIALSEYVSKNNLKNISEVEFIGDDIIKCYMFKYLDSIEMYSLSDLNGSKILINKFKNINLLPDKSILIERLDTTLNLKAWSWDFEGSSESVGYTIMLDYLNINKSSVDSLKELTNKINCHAIKIDINGSVFLRYKGLPMCQAQYVISENEDYLGPGYVKLNNGFYLNIYKDSMLCGNCYWND
jgi:hypothetical protein